MAGRLGGGFWPWAGPVRVPRLLLSSAPTHHPYTPSVPLPSELVFSQPGPTWRSVPLVPITRRTPEDDSPAASEAPV